MSEQDDAIGAVRRARRRLTQVTPAGERGPGDRLRVALPEADGDVLRDLLVAEHARIVIEIGLAYGSSALAIGEALLSQADPPAEHVIIDAYQDDFGDTGWRAVVNAGLNRMAKLIRDRSQLALPRLVTDGLVADAAFVDGSHIFHNVFVDLYFLRELVRATGLVVLDDCQWPSVATAVRYFELNAGWEPLPLPGLTRLRAYRLPSSRVEPRFDDFRPFSEHGGSSPVGT